MQTVKTIPGKTYAVESAGEVIITNTETGAIAAQGDGSGQVLFTACANSYEVSDDTAKVVALFKLAPRLKLTLLQGVAGGWLPAGFTELEYLESSGTQYISTRLEVDATCGARVEWEITKINNYSSVLNASNLDGGGTLINLGSFMVPYWNGVISPFYASFMSNDQHIYTLDAQAEIGVRYVSLLNFRNSREVKLNNSSLGLIPADVQSFVCKNPVLFGSSRSGTPIAGGRLTGKIFRAQISRYSGLVMDLQPALRESDGVPGMFDRVSKQFFVNNGTGSFGYRIKGAPTTFALRDPHRVAPSGVYARLIAENELEIVADTEETTGEGWEWFANTAEAYEYYGIVIHEDFN